MIDPMRRWAAYGEKPDYAGLLSFAGLPYTEDPAELAGADAAIVGAPMDELTSDAPGTRFGPRAIRAASCAAGAAPRGRRRRACGRDCAWSTSATRRSCPPTRCARTAAIEDDGRRPCSRPARCRSCSAATTRSPSPTSAPARRSTGRSGSSTSTPTPTPGARCSASSSRTAARCTGSSSPATSTRRATCRSACAATGRARRSSPGSARHGITSHFMHDVRDRGIRAVVADTARAVGDGPVFVSIDVDVLDPAFAPGTGTPEPGGMTSADLLWRCRTLGASARRSWAPTWSRSCPSASARSTSPRSWPTASCASCSPAWPSAGERAPVPELTAV